MGKKKREHVLFDKLARNRPRICPRIAQEKVVFKKVGTAQGNKDRADS